jgi:hypothetical protein
MTINKFFIALAFAATCTVANAQQPVILSFDSDTIVAKDYETTARIHQTNRLGNTYNKYLVRTDPTTGEKQRYLLSSKPITGFEGYIGIDAHLYNEYVTALPMVGIGYHAPKWILRGGAGIGQTQYMDKASDKYGEKYWSVVARADALYVFHSSAKNNQMLEKHYDAIGFFCEYDNRRNSTAEVIETATQFTKNEDWVQGSSYAVGLEYVHGFTMPKSATRIELGIYAGVGRDYYNEGTKTVMMGGVTLKLTQVFSKTHKIKLGQRVLK